MAARRQAHDHQDAFRDYLGALNKQYGTARPTEHTYRAALAALLGALLPHLNPSNEQGRMGCGAPDIVLLRQGDGVPVAYVETKDIGDPDLEGRRANREQFDRYRQALRSVIFTDYLDFVFCRDGQTTDRVRIAETKDGKIAPLKDQLEKFVGLVEAFGGADPQAIASPAALARIMASKARLMAAVFEESLSDGGGHGLLAGQMEAFKGFLLHDITPREFADIYAQTITYGMFAARIHHASRHAPDPAPAAPFGRRNAAELIPRTNPFLRNLFDTIAGLNIQDGIAWIVDDLAEAFRATDVQAVLRGAWETGADPLIHFYEDFLSAYDPALRKSRGVWYTPKPVVRFMVRAVDEVLQACFGLEKGLADNSKIRIRAQNAEQDVHKVQILDPAAGTGTFLAEAVAKIHEKYRGQAGAWQSYVGQHLLPRLNGFELLMAPYAMAHLSLDWMLAGTGYAHEGSQRLRIYLTNSLEEHHPDTGTLFAQFLANESREANAVKRDAPVMVVMGNPPYSGESKNKGGWMAGLMDDYKLEPGTDRRLAERNSKWINDDYVKFIRLGQHYIGRRGEGVMAYITNHSFLDNPTFRGMRHSLLQSFDSIYIIDLHGNAKKKETAPDGGRDENVFDIQQGVSISIFVRLPGKRPDGRLATVHHHGVHGDRGRKHGFLSTHSLLGVGADAGQTLPAVPFVELRPTGPEYFFVPKSAEGKSEYYNGISVTELFPVNGVGVTTAHDEFVIGDRETLIRRFTDFKKAEPIAEALHRSFEVKRKLGWNILDGWNNLQGEDDLSKFISDYSYRPFDGRCIFYEDRLVWRCVRKVMQHFIGRDNIGLVVGRQGQVVGPMPWNLVFVVKNVTDLNMFYRGGGVLFPLYLYPGAGARAPNLDLGIVGRISGQTGLAFEAERTGGAGSFAPIDLLDYVYAVLHSPAYREKYREFLRTDFPRVPCPADAEEFRRLAGIGAELRALHLMEHGGLKGVIRCHPFPVSGDNVVDRPRWGPPASDTKLHSKNATWLSTRDRRSHGRALPRTPRTLVPGGMNPPCTSDPAAPACNRLIATWYDRGQDRDQDQGRGRVWINAGQYFDNVPETAWELCIGGYRPAQKWLKDRRGRALTFEDIEHYQRMVRALAMTDDIMRRLPRG